MRKHLLPLVVITVLTMVIWLFAEGESLGEDEPNARVQFLGVGDPPVLLVSTPQFDTNVSIVIRGSRGAIQAARSALDNPIVLRPGDPPIIPDTDGVHTIRLREALEAYAPLASTGVIIESVRPQRVDVIVSELVEHELPIVPVLEGIVTEGEPQSQPATARLRVPRALIPELDDITLTARVTSDAIGDDVTSGPRTITVPLRLPVSITGEAGVALLTPRATVSFSLRSTITTRTYPSVPVQLLLSAPGHNGWDITIEPQQQLIEVELEGPSEVLQRFDDSSIRLVAALSLSDVELSRGITEKGVRLIVLRNDLPGSLPEGVRITSTLPTVRFSAQRIAEELPE